MAVYIPMLLIICFILNVNGNEYVKAGKGVYGIDEQLDLVQYDTNSGKATTIQKGPRDAMTGESLDSFDNKNNILYIMITTTIEPLTTGLYGYNLSNPLQEIGFIKLPMIYASNFGGAGEQCVGDTNGSIYVFGHSSTNNTEQLLLKGYRNININQSNLIIETVNIYSNIDDVLLLPGEMSIFDSKRNKLWVAGEGRETAWYYYIDAVTGNIENKIDYTNWPIYASDYDIDLDQIVGISFDGFEPDNEIQYVMKYADPVTLNVTKIFPPFKEWCFWSAIGSINDMDQVWYNLLFNSTEISCRDYNGTQLMDPYLVGVNITTGDIVTDPPLGNTGITWDLFFWDGN